MRHTQGDIDMDDKDLFDPPPPRWFYCVVAVEWIGVAVFFFTGIYYAWRTLT
jgi:hypothetical protein